MWVRKPTGQCWVSLSRWHLQQSQWQKPVICLVICSSRIFWGRWLRIEIAKAFISLCWFQQEPALSESKLALYQKVLCLLGTYFYHLTLVFKEWFLSLSPFTFLLCSWNLLCLIPEDKGDIKQGGNSSGGGEALWVNCCCRNLMEMIPLIIIITTQMWMWWQESMHKHILLQIPVTSQGCPLKSWNQWPVDHRSLFQGEEKSLFF